jgi:arylsulfatase A-like enzyme
MNEIIRFSVAASLGLLPLISVSQGINNKKPNILFILADDLGYTDLDSYSTSNAPLRGGKGYQWEGGIREPYFIFVPWMKLAGKKCDVPVSGTDFYPTILDLAGLPLRFDQHNDGVSLLPLLKGGQIADRALIWHYPHYGGQGGDPSSIILRGDWKLIHYYEDEELYNLKTDLSEDKDVAAKNPALVQQLSSELFDYLNNVKARVPEKDPEYSEEAEKKYLLNIVNNKMPQLEQERKEMLSNDFNPKNKWWGSQIQCEN